MIFRGFLTLSKTILKLKEVSKTYLKGNEEFQALNNITMDFKTKNLSVVVGHSGSGKSTLLRIAGLLESPSSGFVVFNDTDCTNPTPNERLYLIRNEIGIVPPQPNLLEYLTVLENVMLPMTQKEKLKAIDLLKQVGVEKITSYPDQVSLEQQQKVSIARAMINDPQLLLIDEPTTMLSKSSTKNVMELIESLTENLSVITFTDNIKLSKFSNKVYKLNNGVSE